MEQDARAGKSGEITSNFYIHVLDLLAGIGVPHVDPEGELLQHEVTQRLRGLVQYRASKLIRATRGLPANFGEA